MPKHGLEKLIENTHKADKNSIIRTTDLESRVPLFLFILPFLKSEVNIITSVKFQTFTYYSRTVRSSCMKFKQQFEIDNLNVCAKF